MAARDSQTAAPAVAGLKASNEDNSNSGLAEITATAEAGGKATYKAVISGMTKAYNSNRITEENYYLLQWLYRIRRVSCARGLRIGFLRPDFLWSIYRPMMRSKKRRTDDDIPAQDAQ